MAQYKPTAERKDHQLADFPRSSLRSRMRGLLKVSMTMIRHFTSSRTLKTLKRNSLKSKSNFKNEISPFQIVNTFVMAFSKPWQSWCSISKAKIDDDFYFIRCCNQRRNEFFLLRKNSLCPGYIAVEYKPPQ
jgi:hypothetical protein